MISIYLVIGAFAGIMSGLFSIGGGIIVIPAFSAIFLAEKFFPAECVMQASVGTSLAVMIVTSVAALYPHQRHGAVRWGVFRAMLPGLVTGAIVGSIAAHYLPSYFLQIAFGVLLLVLGIRMVLNLHAKESNHVMPMRVIKISAFFMGFLSSLLGVGGGAVIVPFLLRCSMDIREAMGTALACIVPIAVVATLCFMVEGLLFGVHIPNSTGYIYWPAFFGVAVASVLFAPVGAMLAHKLPKEFLKRIFGLFLLLIACDMLFFK